MKKSIVIAFLCVVVVSLSGVLIGTVQSQSEKQRQIDTMFAGAYNSLIAEAYNGNISNDPQNPNRFDIETAKQAYLINRLFSYTSYSDNNALSRLVAILNDSVGSYRCYPEFSFADMPRETFDMLVDLSLHFDDEELTQQALEAFKAELGVNQ